MDEFRCIQSNDPIIGRDADLFVVPITVLPVFPSLRTNCQPANGHCCFDGGGGRLPERSNTAVEGAHANFLLIDSL